MISSERIKPGVIGAFIGAVGVAVVGFSWGGWMTAGKADVMANDRAKAEVVAALLPICVEQAGVDPQIAAKLVTLKETASYSRAGMVMNAGWATMPGTDNADTRVASACAAALLN